MLLMYNSCSQDDCQGLGVLRRLLSELACQSCQVTRGDCGDHDGDDHKREDPDADFHDTDDLVSDNLAIYDHV